MLSRFALIIGYPGEINGENYCEGVLTDVYNYTNYLQSINGGAWEDGDIHYKINISEKELKSYLSYMSRFDYSVVIFAGHGEYSEKYGQTIIQINKNEYILENELLTNTDRQLIIMDCCRVKSKVLVEDSFHKSFSMESKIFQDRLLYKNRFNQLLEKSVHDVIKIYGCSVGETARDLGRKGGLFTKNLIESASGIEDLSIYKTFSKAKNIVVTQSRNKQNPDIEKPRSGVSFPFYIS